MSRLLHILLAFVLLAMPVADSYAAASPQTTKTTKKKKSSKSKKSSSKKSSKPKSSAEARKKQAQTKKQMEQTAKQLKETEEKLNTHLRKVASLEADIEQTAAVAAQLKTRLDSINKRIVVVKDSIATNEAELQRLRDLYTKAVRSSRRNRREMNTLTFIFSASTFRQAWRRMSYLEQYSKWRERKTAQISEIVANLEAQKAELEEMQVKVSNLKREVDAKERKLRADRAELQKIAGELKGKKSELNTMLKRQKSVLDELDAEIERLIIKEAEEQRRREEEEAKRKAAEEAEAKRKAAEAEKKTPTPKEEEKKESPKKDKKADEGTPKSEFVPGATAKNSPGNFAEQKGKLPSPLSHTYVVAKVFGVQKHQSISNVEINNPGIDLETAENATARAVYPGVVSAVFMQQGIGYVVLIRHGEYLTVYANLASIKVKKGQELKTGDEIGGVGHSDANPKRGQLHFEIRREREKFDPRLWLKH